MNQRYRDRCESTLRLDMAAQELLSAGRLTVDHETGFVFARASKTPLKPIGTPNGRGYLRTCVTTRGKAVTLMVHRIVWISAHGVPKIGQQINHKDGKKTNNRLENLELTMASENNAHARALGLWVPNRGLANGFGKLSDEQVRSIREARQRGSSATEIARMFGITTSYARRVASGKARC